MSEDLNPNDNQPKSSDLSEDQPKKVGRFSPLSLTKMIYIVVIATIGFIGINFVTCAFMVPGSIMSADLLGGLKKSPPLDCSKSNDRGYTALTALLMTIIALKAKVEE